MTSRYDGTFGNNFEVHVLTSVGRVLSKQNVIYFEIISFDVVC